MLRYCRTIASVEVVIPHICGLDSLLTSKPTHILVFGISSCIVDRSISQLTHSCAVDQRVSKWHSQGTSTRRQQQTGIYIFIIQIQVTYGIDSLNRARRTTLTSLLNSKFPKSKSDMYPKSKSIPPVKRKHRLKALKHQITPSKDRANVAG